MTTEPLADRPTNAVIDAPLSPEQREAQLRRILTDLMSGWRFAAWTNLLAHDRYFELVKETTDHAVKALEDGVSSYQTLVLVVAPMFLAPGEAEVEVLEATA